MSNNPSITAGKTNLFSTGQVIATQAVVAHLQLHSINANQFIERHSNGDWGNIPPDDIQENIFAIENGLRIMSSYTIANAEIWIITEADRSVTTLLFPSDY